MTNQARYSSIPCLLASCVLFACDVAPDEVAELVDSDVEFRDQTPDPSDSATHDVCQSSGNFNGIPATIRFPEGDTCLVPLSDRPLVVVLHGAGFDYTEYEYLLEHLAANGFVAMSFDFLVSGVNDNQTGHQDGAELLEDALDEMLTEWAYADQIDPSNIALIGHSRGGRTIRYLADELADGADDWTVRAMVTLASKAGSDHSILGNETEALLVLQGGDDADQPPARGFENYDVSDAEPLFGDTITLEKAMKLLEGGVHYNFAEEIGVSTQAHVTKGYVLAFLAQHLLDDDYWYEDYIRGDEVPWGWFERVASQFRDDSRLVVDNFEDGSLTYPKIGGGISISLCVSASVIDLDAEPDAQHETWALELGGGGGESIAWTFTGQDLTHYAWLSLRAGYLEDNGLRGLSVQVRNDGVWSNSVLLSSHGTIQQPMEMCIDAGSASPCDDFDVFAHMGTIRVPLSAFTGDTDDVDGVRLVLGSKYATSTFVLDSIEFAGTP